ncbi:hypothetical protein Tco_0877208 [Tanacetum coccineum]|uniref:Uncharacterized protein n=1 Tax=Tanacetum coccineum TaxID=301880 RepID=A0ABQ5BX27_9ASTR
MKSQVLELLEKLKISDQEMKQQIILFEEDKRMFLAKNEFLEKVSSSVQTEYNDLLASNDVLKQRLETNFKLLKHDTSLEKMFEMIENEYESNVSKLSITSSTYENKNLELVKEMGNIVKHFAEEKKVFVIKISKLEKRSLAQRVKDFDDVKTELSNRTEKFKTYFANLEKQNALLKSQLASQNYTSLKKVLELLEKLKITDQEMKQQIILFEEDKRIFLAKNEFLEKVSSSVQKEYNDLLASNDVLKQRLETKFKLLKHDTSLEKMFEMII